MDQILQLKGKDFPGKRSISIYKKSALKIKGQEKIQQVNSKHQKSGIAILVLDKTDFETRSLASDIPKFKTMSLY